MEVSLWRILLCLSVAILIMVVLTARYRLHPFFALLICSFVMGTGLGMPVETIIATVKDGFGHIMSALGLIIVLGTCLGVILEKSGSTALMANYILNRIGHNNVSAAMNLTGLIVGLPIFCDSGYIVLSGLGNSLSRRSGMPMAVVAGSLACGLYAVHCMIPPHPGAAAAAGILGVEIGRLVLYGIIIAVPASIAGWCWVRFSGKHDAPHQQETGEQVAASEQPGIAVFLPIILPIAMISLHSFTPEGTPGRFLGDPVIALTAGILVALFRHIKTPTHSTIKTGTLLQEAAEKAGGILVIIGAGGAFGAILAKSGLGEQVSRSIDLGQWGLWLPFLITALLKTAQGSSTVAIITAATITAPLLPGLGLAGNDGPLLAVLAMGAGSMFLSHANDAYFWVIARFSEIDMKTMFRVYTVATFFMGITAFTVLLLLRMLLH
ncbi:GntP family permease [Flavihumibacter petaseus]|uniref:Putative gluconate permease n=1 Tax=Flavihumibacter petaseus NBRC 106054 TaxID=1220578 RepID=A0A0E9MXX3_9BACT|nr:GntP family permease [Flavihumibacter petaseus]GAO42572.1 putative gluconate permease [Flavihumibacter petaseus NBRC 106054]